MKNSIDYNEFLTGQKETQAMIINVRNALNNFLELEALSVNNAITCCV